MDGFWVALALTTFAGLSTGFGSAIAFFAKRTNYRFLSVATGFSAGVMIYVSFVEIFFKGAEALTECLGDYWGHWVNAASFFAGIIVIAVIDYLVPEAENPHETHPESELAPLHNPQLSAAEFAAGGQAFPHHHRLMRMGLFTALAIGIHNFPEGLVTFLAALEDPALGVAIAVAIALHNIPEGISVSVPIFYASGSRKKSFIYSFLSGLAEPVGALVAYFILRLIAGGEAGFPSGVMGALFGGVAGIMVYISLDELLPTSRAYGKGHDSLIGLLAGMSVMALSLLLMR